MGILVLAIGLRPEESNLDASVVLIISIHINRSVSAILSQHALVNN